MSSLVAASCATQEAEQQRKPAQQTVLDAEPVVIAPPPPTSPARSDPKDPSMMTACGGCHAYPDPTEFTDRTWARSVPYMYRIHREYFGHLEALPPEEEVARYYRENASGRLPPPPQYPAHEGVPYRWTAHWVDDHPTMVVSFNDRLAVDLMGGRVLELPAISMSARAAHNQTELPKSLTPKSLLSDLDHPIKALRMRLGDDNALVVAELGTFTAKDSQQGRVRLFVGGEERASPIQGLGRVADLAKADLNQDGLSDLILAEFGWQKSGGLHVLYQTKGGQFERRRLDDSAGHMAVDVADMNGDGRLDIVSLVAQHHERIDLWLSSGSGFERQTLFKAHTPLWGSLGLTVVDLDQDGRQDIVHWNGDNLDAPKLASFQGVHWIRNVPGEMRSEQLAVLPGAHDVSVADLDDDGRLDLVAVANLPPRIHETLWPMSEAPEEGVITESILLIRQETVGKFKTESLLRDSGCFVSVDTGDWDGDGRADLVVGHFGLGWSLLGHFGEKGESSRDGSVCRTGGLSFLRRGGSGTHKPGAGRYRPRQMVRALERITQVDRSDAQNRVNLGDALLRQGKYGQADSLFRDALAIDPDEKAAYINLALVLDLRGRSKEAEETCRALLKRHPNFADGYNQLAATLFHQRKVDDAITASETAVRLQPKNVDFLLNLASALASKGDWTRVENTLRRALAIEPNHRGARDRLQQVQYLRRPSP